MRREKEGVGEHSLANRLSECTRFCARIECIQATGLPNCVPQPPLFLVSSGEPSSKVC